MNYPRSFQNLVDCFKRLPGIGGKSAERLAYYILSMDKEYVDDFSKTLASIHSASKAFHCTSGLTCPDLHTFSEPAEVLAP